MNFLISNDDGIDALGIKYLFKIASCFAKCYVVAPNRNYSGYSHSITLNKPIMTKQISNTHIKVYGTPCDCIHLGVTANLLNHKPNLVISGINDALNLGNNTYYSGTLGAAIEGNLLGIPAIAISTENIKKNYHTLKIVINKILKKIRYIIMLKNIILNINIPDCKIHEIKGIKCNKIAQSFIKKPTIINHINKKHKSYIIHSSNTTTEKKTDINAINKNYINITPININITNYKQIKEINFLIKKIII